MRQVMGREWGQWGWAKFIMTFCQVKKKNIQSFVDKTMLLK